MGVGEIDLVDQWLTVGERDLDPPALGLVERIGVGEAAVPFIVLDRLDLAPQPDGLGPAGALRRIASLMVPFAVLKRHGEGVHDGMVQRLAARLGVVFLGIVGARAGDHVGLAL